MLDFDRVLGKAMENGRECPKFADFVAEVG
jgi:hypothetical protein